LIVGNAPLGAKFFQPRVRRKKQKLGSTKHFVNYQLLRWADFMFPPPHPSLKQSCPQGGVSNDQLDYLIIIWSCWFIIILSSGKYQGLFFLTFFSWCSYSSWLGLCLCLCRCRCRCRCLCLCLCLCLSVSLRKTSRSWRYPKLPDTHTHAHATRTHARTHTHTRSLSHTHTQTHAREAPARPATSRVHTHTHTHLHTHTDKHTPGVHLRNLLITYVHCYLHN
jgi:hypothetical protein